MKKPFFHALAAIAYIIVLVLIISSTGSTLPKETVLIPVIMLGVLVLSVSIMGFLFFYEPFTLYMENKKKEAVSFFLKTVGFFACLVLIVVCIHIFLL